MTIPPAYPEQLLKQTAWLARLTRELVPDAHSAADLAQDTLAAALARPEPERANVRTWLERIARNLAAGGIRARSRRKHREQQVAALDAVPSTADTIAHFELHRSVVDAVQVLREPIRTTLLLRFWEDLPPREIAKRMATPVETVRTRIKRGLHELRGTLDTRHGRREAWGVPLLALSPTPTTVAAPVGAAVLLTGFFMKAKALAIGAITLFALGGALVWNLADPSRAELPAPSAPGVAAGSIEASHSQQEAKAERERLAASRTLGLAVTESTADWVDGVVTDASALPLAGVEVALLTEDQADTYRNREDLAPTASALEYQRIRWALWHVSDTGLIKKDAVLGPVFSTKLLARTGADGRFQFRQEDSVGRTVVAVWSPVLGFRLRPFKSLREPIRVVCENWPTVRGELMVAGKLEETVTINIDPDRQDPPRVLTLKMDAPGLFESPQLPPGHHTIEFRTKGFRHLRRELDLVDDAQVDVKLEPFPLLGARLVDSGGNLLDGARITALGWKPGELKFLLLQTDYQNETELARDWNTRSELQFSASDGMLEGRVEDPAALVLSVWSGRERVAATRLPNHLEAEIVLDLPMPRPATTLNVAVSLDAGYEPTSNVSLALGTMVGMASYNFKLVSETEGLGDRYQLDVPAFLRGQSVSLIVQAEGFATQILPVSIPFEGAPQAVTVGMRRAEFTLLGTVVDEDGKPLDGARVKIATLEGEAFRTRRETVVMANEQGQFGFGDLARGSVRLFVSRRGFATTSAVAVTDQETPVTIRMRPGVERRFNLGTAEEPPVGLRVLDAQGSPLKDDRLFGGLHGRVGTRIRLTVDAHTLEVWRPGEAKPVRTINLK